MQLYKPVYKENELKIQESLNRQFLESFRNVPAGEMNPKRAIDTCDLHLDGKQKILLVTPKKEGTEEITWNEPKDIRNFWANYLKYYWLIICVVSSVFFLFIYYFWRML